ncbi:PKD domain-containing protein [Mucilaginibacter sp. Mucisp84]|uniref:PKD domain-containing protein n=1 Tax=Mucilaginibacter sp. Mucisp84 TaxID=3243058 RepID=UPI0039A66372
MIALFFCNSSAFSQVVSNQGTEFWVPFPTHVPDFDKQFNVLPAQISIFITSGQASSGKVTCGSFSGSFTVSANKVTEVQVPRNVAYINNTESGKVLPNRAIHITVDAGKPKVVVYAHIFAGQRSAASLILPAESLGNHYYSMNYKEHDTEGQNYIAIIATEPQTTLHIKRGATELVPGGITLNNVNDTYEYLSNDDLTGVSVSIDETSSQCKHFAMFSGSSGVYISPAACTAKSLDPLFQQCYSVENWGKQYGYIPFSMKSSNFPNPVRTAGQYIRILAGDKPADVKINGQHVAMLPPGTFYTSPDPLPGPAIISASEQVMVAQFALSQSCSNINGNNYGFSDPDMVFLNPINYSIEDITVYSSTRENISEQYLNILIPSAAATSFHVNGQLQEGFSAMPLLPQYSYLQLDLKKFNTSNFHLAADAGFNAIAYGFGDVESYAYSAGTNLASKHSLSGIKASTDLPIDSACLNDDFFFRLTLPYISPKISWKMDNSEAPVIQINPAATLIDIKGRKAYTYKLPKTPAYSSTGVHEYQVIADYPASTIDCGNGKQVINGSFKVIGLPSASFDMFPNDCNFDVNFKNTGNKPDAPLSLLWNFGDELNPVTNTATDDAPQHTFSKTGTYTVTLTVNANNGCNAVLKKQLTIKSRFMPVLEEVPNNCEGELVLFTDKSQNTPNFEIMSRSWDFGDGESTSSLSATITHRYKAAGTYKVRLILKSTQNCVSETAEQTIRISSKPIPEFDLPDICVTDGTATFINKSKPGNGETTGLTYSWHFNDDNATTGNPNGSILTNPKHLFTAAKAYTISLTVTSSGGCDSTITKTLTVNSSPKAGFKILNPQSVCSGQQLFLKDLSSVTDVGSISRLVWYFNAEEDLTDKLEIIHPQAGQIYSHIYAQFYGPVPSMQQRIKLVAYSGDKCYDEYSENISVFAMPKLQFDQLNDICSDAGPVQITGAKEITGLTGGNTLFTGSGTLANGVFFPDHAGVGLHTLTYHFVTASGCADSISRQINVLEPPDAALPSEVYILKGNDLILKPTYRGQNLSYKWNPAISIDDYTIATPRVAPVSSTTYQVEVSNGVCAAYAQINVKVLLPPVIYNTFTPNGDGVNDLWEIPNLKDYPTATVAIFNRYGIKLYGSIGYSQPWNGQYNGKDVPAGTYYYIVNPGNGQKTYSGNVTVIR